VVVLVPKLGSGSRSVSGSRSPLGLAVAGALAVGCAKPATAPVATAPTADLGGSRCSVKRGADNPFIVEWDGTDRARLESAIRKGVVAVRYQGCEVELLPACNADMTYDYVALTPKQESVEVRDTDELYARFPRGAVRLEGKLERAGSLSVDMMVVGRHEAPSIRIEREQLRGTCLTATHVVTGLSVGAFQFHTGAKAELAASVEIGNDGEVGRASEAQREELSTDGDVAACQLAAPGDPAPPERCGAIMRIEVVPLPERGADEALAYAGKGRFERGAPWRRKYVIGTWMWGTAGAGFAMFIGGQIVADRDTPGAEAAGLTMLALGGTAMLGGIIAGATLYGLGARERRMTAEKALRARQSRLELGPQGVRLRF
jgi:hypothetical protein